MRSNASPLLGMDCGIFQDENVRQNTVKGQADNNKTPSTKRRAFGDISNRKDPLQSSQKVFLHQTTQKSVSFQPSKTPAAQPSLSSRTPKGSIGRFDDTLPRSIRSNQKTPLPKTPSLIKQEDHVEDVEWPAGRLYINQQDFWDDELSLCSMEEYIRDSWQAVEDIYKARSINQKLAFQTQAQEGDEYHRDMMKIIDQEDSLCMQAPDDFFDAQVPIDMSLEDDNEGFIGSFHITDISF
jgi:hypothetical protein